MGSVLNAFTSSDDLLVTGELPEAFFTPTTADLKAAQDSLTARTQALVNAPLKTQAMRDVEQKAREAKYPTVCFLPRSATTL